MHTRKLPLNVSLFLPVIRNRCTVPLHLQYYCNQDPIQQQMYCLSVFYRVSLHPGINERECIITFTLLYFTSFVKDEMAYPKLHNTQKLSNAIFIRWTDSFKPHCRSYYISIESGCCEQILKLQFLPSNSFECVGHESF